MRRSPVLRRRPLPAQPRRSAAALFSRCRRTSPLAPIHFQIRHFQSEWISPSPSNSSPFLIWPGALSHALAHKCLPSPIQLDRTLQAASRLRAPQRSSAAAPPKAITGAAAPTRPPRILTRLQPVCPCAFLCVCLCVSSPVCTCLSVCLSVCLCVPACVCVRTMLRALCVRLHGSNSGCHPERQRLLAPAERCPALPCAATADDLSCRYPGCTDPRADNFSPAATIDDGSCVIRMPCGEALAGLADPINRLCCPTGGCADGVPTACTARCAAMWLPFATVCCAVARTASWPLSL